MKIGCLGPAGSYSEVAAKKLSPDAEVVLFRNFPAVVSALRTGAVDEIALPIENTIQGGVLQNMDLLADERDLFAVREYILPIEHRLVYRKGGSLADIAKVYSHPQALGQCSVFLSEKLPHVRPMPVESTAEGLSRVKAPGDAAIVGAHLYAGLEECGLEAYPGNIADEKKNFTYFELVKKGEKWLDRPSTHVYFVAKLLHRPGSLYRLLGVINSYGLNMTKIESRPIKDTPGEYRFFIEVEGNYLSAEMERALADMRRICQDFKLLGCY